jgi:hypothetical protein
VRRRAGEAHERRRNAVRHDAPVVEQHHAVAEPLGLLDLVRAPQRGDAARGLLADRFEDALARLRIDADGRLVEQQHARLVQQRTHEIEAPPHSTRERRHRLVAAVLETGQHQRALGGRVHGCARQSGGARKERQVLACGEARIEGKALRDESRHALRLCARRHDIESAHGDRAFARWDQAGENRERARLAGAIRAEQPDDLAGGRRERHVAKRLTRAVAHAQIIDADLRLGHGLWSRASSLHDGIPGTRTPQLCEIDPNRRVGLLTRRSPEAS